MTGILMVSYLLDMYAKKMGKAEKENLLRLAYEDELTGLANRTKGEEVLSAAAEWSEEYAVINLDLNGLKVVNDKYGHAGGDKYIGDFAKILKEVFADEEVAARMGGDEFFVMVREKNLSGMEEKLSRMKKGCHQASLLSEFEIDVSYGVARSSEMAIPEPEKLYKLADERMYAMKVASKKARV